MILMPSVGVGPFTRSVATQLRVLALGLCHSLTLYQIRELLSQCAFLEDLGLHLCCCDRGVAMKTGCPPSMYGNGVNKTVHKLMLCFCQKVDVGAKSMARKVLELCPQVQKLSLKLGRKLDPVALLSSRVSALEELSSVVSCQRRLC